jgi:hypothetical protein
MSSQFSRNSLDNLKRSAKRWLKALRDGDAAAQERLARALPYVPVEPVLRDIQHALAREHGFPGWTELKQQLVQFDSADARSVEKLEQFEKLVEALVLAHVTGESDVMSFVGAHFRTNFTHEELRWRLAERLGYSRDDAASVQFGVSEARIVVARLYGFESWAKFAESLLKPPVDPKSAPLGMSSSTPFYKIDWKVSRLEVRPPMSERDWDEVFAVIKEHAITSLDAGGQMTDAAIGRLEAAGDLRSLLLGGSQQLTDDGLLKLAGVPQLEELDLSGWHNPITDRGLEVLRHLPSLRRFQMCWPQGVTDAGISNLRYCARLESVDLLGTQTGDGAIRALAGREHVRRLKTGRLVSDAGLLQLRDIPVFESWLGGEPGYSLMSPDASPNHLLIDGPFTDAGLTALAQLDGLFGLSFFWHCTAFTSEGLAVLREMKNLGFLGCQGENCDDRAMLHIGAIPGLRMLMGQGTIASDEGFESLSRSQSIEYIWGRDCPNLGGPGFRALARMSSLKGIAVSCKNVDHESLASLPLFPALRELMPMDVLDDGFRHVGRCETLEQLWCMYCRETGDEATEHIAGLPRLWNYYAGKTRITDRSLELLGVMQSLEKLEFWECGGLSDAGMTHLSGLPRLREVTVGGSPRVSREGMAVFPSHVSVNYW